MSVDIGLICFQHGETGDLPAEFVEKLLSPYIRIIKTPDQDDLWELVFPDGGGGEMLPVNEGDFDLCINRPSGADLYDVIFEIMKHSHSLFWSSGMEIMLTADPAIETHLPSDYIDENGAPLLILSGADILTELARN